MWTLCGSQKPHKQGGSLALFWVWHVDFIRSLQQVRCSHLFRLIHTRVWCGKQTYDGSLGEKFLAHLQLKRNFSPTWLSSAQHIFHGAHLSSFWESVHLCLLLGQHSGKQCHFCLHVRLSSTLSLGDITAFAFWAFFFCDETSSFGFYSSPSTILE